MDILLNWLWRGGIVAAAAGLLVWALGPLAPRTRYRIWWAALALTLFLPLLPAMNDAWMPEVAAPALVGRLSPLVSLPDSAARVNVVLLGLWLAWIGGVGGRMLRAAAATRAARRRALPVDPRLEQRLARWASLRGRGRRTRLTVSGDVRLAAVLGVGSPVIAVSPTVITALSCEDLDRVIAHEWAHVQRRDDLANALQLVVRGIIGWHPAAWWIARQLDLERELACDEQASTLTGGVKPYASCLATLASLTVRGAALPVPAALNSSHIGRRVSRILALPRISTGRWSRGAATVSTGALCLLASGVASVDLVRVYAAEVAAAIEGRSFSLPNLRTPDVGATLTGASDAAQNAVGAGTHDRDGAPGSAARTESLPSPVNDTAPGTEAAPPVDASGEGHTPPDAAPPALAATPLPPLPPLPLAASAAANGPAAAAARPWTLAAEAGVAVGAGSQKAALATASFFTRVGKSVARSF